VKGGSAGGLLRDGEGGGFEDVASTLTEEPLRFSLEPLFPLLEAVSVGMEVALLLVNFESENGLAGGLSGGLSNLNEKSDELVLGKEVLIPILDFVSFFSVFVLEIIVGGVVNSTDLRLESFFSKYSGERLLECFDFVSILSVFVLPNIAASIDLRFE